MCKIEQFLRDGSRGRVQVTANMHDAFETDRVGQRIFAALSFPRCMIFIAAAVRFRSRKARPGWAIWFCEFVVFASDGRRGATLLCSHFDDGVVEHASSTLLFIKATPFECTPTLWKQWKERDERSGGRKGTRNVREGSTRTIGSANSGKQRFHVSVPRRSSIVCLLTIVIKLGAPLVYSSAEEEPSFPSRCTVCVIARTK